MDDVGHLASLACRGVFIPGSRDDAWLAKLQTIYRVESAVLLSVIGVGLTLCALGAVVHLRLRSFTEFNLGKRVVTEING